MALKFTVIYGSVRTERAGLGVAKHVVKELEARGGEVFFADPKELDLPMIDYRYEEMEKAGTLSPKLKELGDAIKASSGIVFVSAEYNHGIPAALKNIIDICGGLFKGPKVGGIVTYSVGGYGGARAATQLRVSPGGLLPMLPVMMNVPNMTASISEEGDAQNDGVAGSSKAFHDQMVWWAEAAADRAAK